MKYRNDFVTNSSSSSFIICFNNKKELEEAKKEMQKYYSNDLINELFLNIENNKCTYQDMKAFYKKYAHSQAYMDIFYGDLADIYQVSGKSFEWRQSEECQKLIDSVAKSKIEYFERAINHRGFLSIINYADDTDYGCKMEHDIVPSLPFVFERFNEH